MVTARQIAVLQRTAGNGAVSALLRGAAQGEGVAARPVPTGPAAGQTAATVQRAAENAPAATPTPAPAAADESWWSWLATPVTTVLGRFQRLLNGMQRVIAEPDIVIAPIREAVGAMVAQVPGAAHAATARAGTSSRPGRDDLDGIVRHLDPKLAYLRDNWWTVIQDALWGMIWPWPGVAQHYEEAMKHVDRVRSLVGEGKLSGAIDEGLAVTREVTGILGLLWGWMAIGSALIGGVLGGIFGVGAGALPGAAAGLALAGKVGMGILLADAAANAASIDRAASNLKAANRTDDGAEDDYEVISSSGLTLAITGVMVGISAMASRFARALHARVRNLFVPRGKPSPIANGAPEVASTEATAPGKTAAPEPATVAEAPTEGGGRVRVREDGRCIVCASPCEDPEIKFADALREKSSLAQELQQAQAVQPPQARAAAVAKVVKKLQATQDALIATGRRVAGGSARAQAGLDRLVRLGHGHVVANMVASESERGVVLLLEQISELTDRQINGLAAVKRAVADLGGDVTGWSTVLDKEFAKFRGPLLERVADIEGSVDGGLDLVLERGLEGGAHDIQGTLGQLDAALSLRASFPRARFDFEVSATGREIDIQMSVGGRTIDVEVKTNLGGRASLDKTQIRKDLERHVGDQWADLLYRYHASAGDLKAVQETILSELRELHKAGQLRGMRLDQAEAILRSRFNAPDPWKLVDVY